MTTETDERRAQMFERTTDECLVGSLRLLAKRPSSSVVAIPGAGTEEGRLVAAWLCDEVVRRWPALDALVADWSGRLEESRTYAEVLLDGIDAGRHVACST